MSDLDKRLEEIVQRCDYSNNMVDPISDPIEAIKNAFIDEGWQKPNAFDQVAFTTIYKDGKTTIVPSQPDLMTGQEWYDRFQEKLYKEFPNIDKPGYTSHLFRDQAIAAARRASGIKEQD